MYHFRPRRQLRRLVDHLTLFFATSTFTFRPATPHHASSNWHRAVRSGHFWPRLLRSRKRSGFGHRRYLALMTTLLALSLEVCGCDVAEEATLQLQASSGSLGARRAVPAEQRLSFYDPTETVREPLPVPSAGGEALPPVRPPLHEAKPLPWAIPESVFFVYRSVEHGPGGPARQPVATAFVLSVPDHRHRSFVRFLVVGRHIVDPEWAHCAEDNPSSIDLRLNRRAGGVGFETISLRSGERRRFYTPSDSTADLAVIPLDQTLIANLDEYKFIDVPFRLLPTDSERIGFRAEQPVMTARIPSWRPAGPGNFPVSDAGVLSKMPTETVNVQCGGAPERPQRSKQLHLWFINAGTTQGSSGAPVYTAMARGADSSKTPVLLGIQSVAWPDQGVAGITPSPVLRDLIQTALRENRASMDFYKGPDPLPDENARSIY